MTGRCIHWEQTLIISATEATVGEPKGLLEGYWGWGDALRIKELGALTYQKSLVRTLPPPTPNALTLGGSECASRF